MTRHATPATLHHLAILLLALTLPGLARAETAVFAGGCFWCMEQAYEELDGVADVVSGFTGGTLQNPTYSGNHKGHYEAVKVSYDPDIVSYQQLLDHYWVNIDPLDDSGQFCDKGHSYRAAVFVANARERELAEASLTAVQARFPDQPVVTQVLDADRFWPVEEAHQDYYRKNPLRYRYYKYGCGRPARLAELWGKD